MKTNGSRHALVRRGGVVMGINKEELTHTETKYSIPIFLSSPDIYLETVVCCRADTGTIRQQTTENYSTYEINHVTCGKRMYE